MVSPHFYFWHCHICGVFIPLFRFAPGMICWFTNIYTDSVNAEVCEQIGTQVLARWGLTRNVRCCGLLDSTAVSAPAAKPIQAQLRVLKKDEHGLRDKLIPAAPWRVLTRLHDAGKHAVTLT